MLYSYFSNDVDNLKIIALKLLDNIQQKLKPLEDLEIIVPSLGIGRFLLLEIAKEQGIAMNIKTILPAQFLWNLAKEIFNEEEIPNLQALNHNALTLRIFAIINNDFPYLREYKENTNSKQLFELAAQIANIFYQYLLYRPQWLENWENDKLLNLGVSEFWQAKLWQQIATKTPFHRARFLTQLNEALKNESLELDLPQDIVIFATSGAIGLEQLELIDKISNKTNIHLLIFNPAQGFWEDINKNESFDSDFLLPLPNKILATCGAQGKHFVHKAYFLTEKKNGQIIELFNDFTDTSLLNAIKQDILLARTRDENEKFQRANDDYSLVITNNFSALREVQELHNFLTYQIQNNNIKASEIVVLSPDITEYLPIINAIFSSSNPKLSFAIADNLNYKIAYFNEAIFKLINLHSSIFSLEEIFEILNYEFIANKFNFADMNLIDLQTQLINAGAIFAFDENHKDALNLPKTNIFTLKFAIERLLFGFLNHKEDGLFLDTATLDINNKTAANAFANFNNFIDVLYNFSKELKQERDFNEWQDFLTNSIKNMLDVDLVENEFINFTNSLQEMSEYAKLTDFQEKINVQILQSNLENLLNNQKSQSGFLSGKITFASITPMRSLPFKVVCLLGLNEGKLPRIKATLSFDLLTQNPNFDIRNQKLDDRYLFLETILSAKEILYLSFIGQNVQNGEVLAPAIVLEEFIETIQDTISENSQLPVFKTALNAFNYQNFTNENYLLSFNEYWFKTANALLNYEKNQQIFEFTLEKQSEYSLQDFIAAFENIAKWTILNLNAKKPFLVNTKNEELWSLTNKQKRKILKQKTLNNELLYKKALLTENQDISQIYLSKDLENLTNFQETLRAFKQETSEFIKINYCFQDISFIGEIAIQQAEILHFSLYEMNGRTFVNFYLTHLFLNLEQTITSKIVCLDVAKNTSQIYILEPIKNTKEILDKWSEVFVKSLANRIYLPINSAFVFSKEMLNVKSNEEKAYQKMINEFYGSFMKKAEIEDEYLNIYFRELKDEFKGDFYLKFKDLCQELLIPALEFLQVEK